MGGEGGCVGDLRPLLVVCVMGECWSNGNRSGRSVECGRPDFRLRLWLVEWI